jgi:N-acetylglucosaminyldiphosphoundecaprenol N-acetyl-beta-D-mannosaminyltransferase
MKKETAIKLLEEVRETYDTIAADFDRTRQRVWPEFDKFTDYLPSEAKILDIGCGNGRLLKYLKDKDYHSYLGVDNSKELLELAKEQHSGKKDHFKVGDQTGIPVEDGSHDVVFSIAALHHIPSRALQLKAMGECHRALTPNGVLLLTVWDLYRWKSLPYYFHAFIRSIFTLGNYSRRDLFVPWGKKNPKMRYCYAFMMPELRELLSDAGFEIMSSWTVGTGKSGNHVIVARPYNPANAFGSTKVMGVEFDAVKLDDAVDLVGGFLKSGRQHYVVTPNPEILLKARKDDSYRDLLNNASLRIPDGTGILWASSHVVGKRGPFRWILGLWGLLMTAAWPSRIRTVLPERVTGTDLMEEILDQSYVMDAKIFLLGAHPGVARDVAQKWRVADIVGTYAGSPAPKDEEEILRRINDSGANLVFVAYGAPKQEEWISRNLKKMPDVRVAIGVGGAFDFIAGNRSRAPRWMQKLGIEWLWRVTQEPKRIKRILDATVVFPIRVMLGRD